VDRAALIVDSSLFVALRRDRVIDTIGQLAKPSELVLGDVLESRAESLRIDRPALNE
jgi:hypothetical protein